MAHANRNKAWAITAAEVIAARERADLTVEAAAALVFSTATAWQDWEAGKRSMHPGLYQLFLLKTAR
jgi:putative transcriptional regulator